MSDAQSKYDECLAILAALHDVCHMMIESGEDDGMSSFQLVEEALATLASAEGIINGKDVTVDKKEKKIVH
jgi:hypothetical protein